MSTSKKFVCLIPFFLELAHSRLIAFRWSSSFLFDAFGLEASSHFANCVQDMIIDFCHRMEHVQLVFCFRPNFSDCFCWHATNLRTEDRSHPVKVAQSSTAIHIEAGISAYFLGDPRKFNVSKRTQSAVTPKLTRTRVAMPSGSRSNPRSTCSEPM